MSENLVLEFGNTRWKLGEVHESHHVTPLQSGHSDQALVSAILEFAPKSIAVASVAAPQRVELLQSALRNTEIQLRIATPEPGFGIRLCYPEPARLGVDRWLALLAAKHSQPKRALSHVVIDAGTAVTMDVLDSTGQHLGGWIAPGFHLMQDALVQKSTRLQIDTRVPSDTLGKDTASGIYLGCKASLQGFVVGALESAERALGEAADVLWLTGGDSHLINKKGLQLAGHTQLIERPHMVLEGLAYWLTLHSSNSN